MIGPTASPEAAMAAQEALARPAGLAPGSVEAQLITSAKNSSVSEGLQIMAGKKPDFATILTFTEDQVGYKDHTGAIIRTAAQTNLATEARNIDNHIKELSEKGFNNPALNPATKTFLIDIVANDVLNSPQQANRLDAFTTPITKLAEAKRIAEEHLNDPAAQREIIKSLNTVADFSKPIEDKVTPAEAELHRLEQERDKLKDLYDGPDGVKGKHDSKKKAVEAYNQKEDPAHPGTFIEGLKYTELNTEKTNKAGYEATINDLQGSVIPGIENEISQLNQEYNSALEVLKLDHPGVTDIDHLIANGFTRTTAQLRTEVTVKQTELRTKRTELTTTSANEKKSETKITKLEEEKRQYESELKELETKTEKAKDAYDKAKGEYDKQEIKRNTSIKEKEVLERAWVDQLRNIIPNVINQKFQTEIQQLVTKAQELIDKKITEETAANNKKFLEYEKRQHFGPDYKLRKANIERNQRKLMRGGESATFTWVEAGVTQTEILTLNGAERTLVDLMDGAGLSRKEIYMQIKDETTRKNMSEKLAEDILSNYLLSGGRLTEAQAQFIQHSDWGIGMVEKAMTARDNKGAFMDSLIGKNVLTSGDNLKEQLKKVDWKKFLIILLAIAGIMGGVALLKK